MIIPVRCFTCGKVLCDKWEYYKERVAALERENAQQKKPQQQAFDGNAHGHILDDMGLKRMCCRRHILGHVDLIDAI